MSTTIAQAQPRADLRGDRARPEARVVMAALDLGTNNCRLLVAEPRGGAGFRVVDSFSRIVRLGEGLAATDRLSEAAMERTLAALKVCRQVIDRHRATHARCVATEACRRAVNGPGFLRRARDEAGIELELLHHDDEARLAMLGCLPLVDPGADELLMVDIGGGSTELLWLDRRSRPNGREPGFAASVPLGVVTLSESFGGATDPASYAAMVEHVHARLLAAGRTREIATASRPGRLQMLGTSGTVTTLAAVHLGLRRYDRRRIDGLEISFAAIQAVSAWLRTLPNGARAAHPCIGQGRADLVVAGCAILDAVHRLWPVERLWVADRGLREGILGQLMGHDLRQALLPDAFELPPTAA